MMAVNSASVDSQQRLEIRQPPDPRLCRIAARAETLWQRLAVSAETPASTSPASPQAEERLDRWRQKCAGGNNENFARRLSWLGTTPERAIHSLEDRQVLEPPPWAELFGEALEVAAETPTGETTPHAFGDLLQPFVQTGLDRLAPICHQVFNPTARATLADDLCRRLSHIAGLPLLQEFDRFRATNGTEGSYHAFAAELAAGGWWNLAEQYPVLPRLLATTVDLWAHHVSELARAFADDLPDLRRTFGEGCGERIVALRPSLSDRHHGGRTVTRVEVEGGISLIHKPRDLGIERAFSTLLERLNTLGDETFLPLVVLERNGYGWVEAIDPAPCCDGAEAASFYRRAGGLLCLLYVLDATDCFYENVIARGSHPVLIDLETLLRPRLASPEAPDAATQGFVAETVLAAGFLPAWEAGIDGTCIDISGLGARFGQTSPYSKRRWLRVNSDTMELRRESIRVASAAHLPHLAGRALEPADYSDEIVTGFRRTYDLLCTHREMLMAESDGPLRDLGRQVIRVIVHPTRVYGLLSERLFAAQHLRSGIERSIEIDLLARLYIGSPTKGRLQAVLAAEVEDMELLDFPHFAVRADQRDLSLPGDRRVDEAFAEAAADRARQRLESLNPADCELQAALIRASLWASVPKASSDSSAPAEDQQPWQEAAQLSREELIAEATRLASDLAATAIRLRGDSGGVQWIAPQRLPAAGRLELRPLGPDLYSGLAGVALFFAAVDRVSDSPLEDESTFRALALAALVPVRRILAADSQKNDKPLGTATGTGGLIYSLTRCAALLQEPELLTEARRAAARITDEQIAADRSFDVTAGVAGAILALLALHREVGDDDTLATARRCGEHLLTAPQPALAGFAHGAAGIALALQRLAVVSDEDRFLQAAERMIAFERSLFDPDAGNWPDLRHGPAKRGAFSNAWCHGAAGIGLARAAAFAEFPETCPKGTREEVEVALAAVERDGIGAKDGLCCGNLGRLDLLLAAAAAGIGDSLEARAVVRASQVVARARRTDGYHLTGRRQEDLADPSFFQGYAGIGYQLLRIARPELLPSVSTWR